jgi:integrase
VKVVSSRRSYGTGSLLVRRDAQGRESWYGRWRADGRRLQRLIGPKRHSGRRDGLTRAQAERELARLIDRERGRPAAQITVDAAGTQLIARLQALGRKPTTIDTYRSLLRTHLSLLEEAELDRIRPHDVEDLIGRIRRAGTGPKTTRNAITLLHQIFEFGRRKGWCRDNPCTGIELPRLDESAEIHFLDQPELEAVLRAVDVDAEPFGGMDRTLFLVAAMTGLRQGELLALRWRDVDWTARKVRVRRNYVRGHWGTPKSRRGSRSVPMADRVATELERLFQRSSYQDDDALVFGHPHTGKVLDHSQLVRRFKAALKAGGVRPVRFNDLRHTFGTRMAAANVPLRTLQEWMGHRDIKTTQIYADYQPDDRREAELVDRAFAQGSIQGSNLSASERTDQTSGRLIKPS